MPALTKHKITLHATATDGDPLEATYLPAGGMNLVSFKKGEQEVMAQSTWADYEDRFAGLGALIGPHFHRRPDHLLKPIPHAERFPHIAHVIAHGGDSHDPFSHGVARYAPWQFQATEQRIEARLSGKNEWQGVPLAELEGQMFEMWYTAELSPAGLALDLSIKSEADSMVGFHFYYQLVNGSGRVEAKVQDQFRDLDGWHPLRPEWNYQTDRTLVYPLESNTDWGFQPFPDQLNGEMHLYTGDYRLTVNYHCDNAENSWQMWHPKGAAFACIEPLSAKDPRKPQLTASALKMRLAIDAPQSSS